MTLAFDPLLAQAAQQAQVYAQAKADRDDKAGTPGKTRKRGRPKGSTLTPDQKRARAAQRRREYRMRKKGIHPDERKRLPIVADLTESERRDRGEVMLATRMQGAYLADIAKLFNTTETSAKRELEAARRRAIQGKGIEYLTTVLLPKALAIYSLALDQGDIDVATKVLEGVGVIGKGSVVQLAMPEGGSSGGDTFEQWRLEISRAVRQPSGAARLGPGGSSDADQPSPAIDAEVVEARVGAADGADGEEGV